MARKIKPLQLVEMTGENFKSLADAQRAALPGLANDLGETLRAFSSRLRPWLRERMRPGW
jgi:broad specificity phosphatase PhoE